MPNARPSHPAQADVSDAEYEHALAFLYDRINYERLVKGASRYQFRLQRIAELLKRLDLSGYLHDSGRSPQDRPTVPLVHIAGTKGKGSTASMVGAILSASGLRTGVYTSPHLHDLEERFRVDGQLCSRAEMVSLVERIEPAAEALAKSHGPASFFELTTAMAILHFHTSGCDAIVLEVGLGGRLDSTNVCWPSVCAVTSIGLDHQHVLGDTLVEIATEKAGILKARVPVISGVVDREAANVVAARADQLNAPLLELGRDFDFAVEADERWGSVLDYRAPSSPDFRCPIAMEGTHQARNAAIALAICTQLQGQGVPVTEQAMTVGLSELQCPGRIERFDLPNKVIGIIDAAHNEDSVGALCDCLQRRAKGQPVVVVFGTSIDKSAAPMLELLSSVADHLVLTRFFSNPRFQPPDELQSLVPSALESTTRLIEDPVQACESALEQLQSDDTQAGGMLVVCGSFFLAAETRQWMAGKAVANR
ncbi:MAG: folylpolyglutamate synthase/dihydrofolate synthase family protein [Rubripirellula sp.]